MVPRFFVPALAPGEQVVTLPSAEGKHLARVLRLRAGDAVRAFDGRGHEFLARVEDAGRTGVSIRLVEPIAPTPESPISLTVAQSVLTGDKMDAVVRDLTMLGVTTIQPILASRSELSRAALLRARRIDRWQRVATASAKQCGRAVLPSLGDPLELQDWLRTDTSGIRLILIEPAGDVPSGGPGARQAGADKPHTSISLLVGPEGGWTAGEASQAVRAGFVPWTLGARTLRADAAPQVAVSILQFLWGDLS